MNVDRLDPQISIGSTKITWVPRFVDHDSNAFYRGKVLTAAEYNDALLQLVYQGNYISDSLVEILDHLPDLYMSSSTKYGADLAVSGTTVQLLDQDGNALGDPITTQDTGATSTAITGSGNAFTGVAYDAATRKLTFTKGDVFVKADNFDTYFDARVDNALATDSVNPVQNSVIAQLIPDAASSSNKLADKSYVASTTLPSSTKYAAGIALSMDSSTYVVTAQLKDQDGNNIGDPKTVDLPIESVVVSGAYDSINKKVVLTLKSGSTIDFSVADLISGLVSSSLTIAGVDLADNITKSELLTALNVADGAQVNTVNSVNTKTGDVVLSYSDVGAEAAFTKNTAFNKDFETSTTNIKANGTVSVGSATTVARADHIHPSDTTKLDANQGSANSGKLLKVGSDGAVVPYTLDLSGYASKVTPTTYTLTSSNWSSKKYTLSPTGKTSSNHARISAWGGDANSTSSQVLANHNAILAANLYEFVESGSNIVITCENTPSTDLKIVVEVYD